MKTKLMKLKRLKLMIDSVIFLCLPGPGDCMSRSRLGMGTLDQVTAVKIQSGGRGDIENAGRIF